MNKFYTKILTLFFVLFFIQDASSQIPELMYFKFDAATGSVINNDAQAATRVCPSATMTGQNINSPGQFFTALTNTATGSTATGWPLNLSGGWTMSFWLKLDPAAGFGYIFGSSNFRAFTSGGTASTLLFSGGGTANLTAFTITTPTALSVAKVFHLVYTTTGNIAVYIDGVFLTNFAQPANMTLTDAAFSLFANSTSAPTAGLMDEFRLYNRSLTAAEVSSTWNVDLLSTSGGGGGNPVNVPPLANFDFTLGVDTLWLNSPSTIYNTSTGSDTNYWNIRGFNAISATGPFLEYTADRVTYDFGGVMDSTVNFSYTFPATGYYLVELNAKNKNGRSTVIKPVYVSRVTRKPVAIWFGDKRVVGKFGEVRLNDQSSFGPTSWKWTFSPLCYDCGSPFQNSITGASSSKAVFSAQEPGKYSVCMEVSNELGKDSLCRTQYIEVKNGYKICTGILENFSSDAEGFLSSSGLTVPGMPYFYNAPNCSYGFKIAPCADTITVSIERLRIRSTDSVFVRSGSISGPKLRRWGGNKLTAYHDSLRTITFAGLELFVTFEGPTSGSPIQDSGFTLRWTSKPASYGKPTATFNIPDTIYSEYQLFPQNNTTGVNVKYAWDLNGDGIYGEDKTDQGRDSVSKSPNVTFITTLPVYRNIRLRAYNCAGSDTMKKTILVLPIIEKPVTGFTVDRRTGLVGADVFTFTDLSQKGATSWLWRFTPSSVVFADGTSATSQNPKIVVTSTQKYSVTLTTSNTIGKDSLTYNNFVEGYAYEIPNSINDAAGISSDMGITRVKSGSIDTTLAAKAVTYTSLINLQKTTVYRGASYAVDVYRASALDAQALKVWIDFNRNTAFETPELIYREDSSNKIKTTATFNVPVDAPVGNTRMRVGAAALPVSVFTPLLAGVGVYRDFGIVVGTDAVRPVISLKGAATFKTEVNKPYQDPGYTATDNIEGDISSRVTVSGTVDVTRVGYQTLKYFVKDYYNNYSDTLTRVVQVEVNRTGPVITLAGSDTVYTEVFGSFTEPGYSAVDNTGNDISSLIHRTAEYDTTKLGTYTVTYTVTDAFGFSVSKNRTLIIRDTQKPVINTLQHPARVSGDTVVHQKGNVYGDRDYFQLRDNYWSPENITLTRTGTINVNTKGIYTLRYQAKDGSGNASDEYVLYVYVKDLVSPVILLTGKNPLHVNVNDVIKDPGAEASDNITPPGRLTVLSNWSTAVDFRTVSGANGYKVTYSVTDEDNNTTTEIRTVLVEDLEAPVITLLGQNPFSMVRGTSFNPQRDVDFKVTDNYCTGNDITVTIDKSGLNENLAGKTYFVYYNATDKFGNVAATRFREIFVREWLTGVQETAEVNDGFTVYPNPTEGLVTLDLKKKDLHTVIVMNLLGEEVMRKDVNGEVTVGLDLSALNAGIYLVRTEGRSGVYTSKVMLKN